jgi:hypothetical protein
VSHAAPFDTFEEGFTRIEATPARPLDPAFRGIVIAATGVPLWAARSRTAHVPLSGLVTTSSRELRATDVLSNLTLLACNHLGQTREGTFEVVPNPVPRNGAPPGRGDGMVTTSYFNVDLADVLELPRRPAVYFVYAFLGPYVSNVVRIEVVDPEASP